MLMAHMATTSPVTVEAPKQKDFFASGMAIVWAIALAKFLVHVYFNNRYGYFRDEFDYMSCGDHLQLSLIHI